MFDDTLEQKKINRNRMKEKRNEKASRKKEIHNKTQLQKG